jgi:hypothetical protein
MRDSWIGCTRTSDTAQPLDHSIGKWSLLPAQRHVGELQWDRSGSLNLPLP